MTRLGCAKHDFSSVFALQYGITAFSDSITLLCVAISVADLEIFRGGFSITKTPAKLEVKTKKKKKKVFTSLLDYLFLAAVSLPSSTAPKLTQ